MPAEKNECGNVPTHDKHGQCGTYEAGAEKADIAKVLGRKIQRVDSIHFHEGAVYGRKKNKPEKDQYLEFFKVKQHQLKGERIKYRA